MHWTALLARHGPTPDAQVVDDLACIGCGYNLRGRRIRDRCSECGQTVGESLFVLRDPRGVTGAVRVAVWGVVSILALLLMTIGSAIAAGMFWLGLGLAILGAGLRVSSAYQLRFRVGLGYLPVLGVRLGRFWWLAMIELGLVIAFAALAYAATDGRFGASVDHLAAAAGIGWLAALLLADLALAGVGASLAVMLGYDFVRRELVRHQVLVLVVPATTALLIWTDRLLITTGVYAGNWPILTIVAIALLGIFGLITLLDLIGGLLHLASAAEKSLEERTDVIEQPAPGDSPPPHPPGPELPDIRID